MGRFYGAVGYAENIETSPGVWEATITERMYGGDVVKNSKKWQEGESLNDDLTINNEITIVADPFAYENLPMMRYVTWMGTNWKILNIDIQRPRLRITIGGVYNG
jgi:hypothetical protein